jgi:hypothetical protein
VVCLNSAGIQHNTAAGTNAGWLDKSKVRMGKHDQEETYAKVCGELSSNNTIGSMSASDLSPNNTKFGATFLSLSLVDISDFLAQVVIRGGLVIDTIDLEEICVVVGVTASPR